ncbi:MAG: plasmid mobilization relaxosome protein MobC [Ruminococcus sp.]|nr:plasmid mobilization relaxosome protein MobC [Ruminococcus sp.]
MEDKNKRNQYLKIRVSQTEMDAIKKKFQNSGMKTLSGFVRAMIFEGYIVQIDENEIHAIYKLVGYIANSINQIALRVNRTDHIYAKDIEDIESRLNMLWQQLHFLNDKILQMKR